MKNIWVLNVCFALYLAINCTQHLYKFVPDHCLIRDVNHSLVKNYTFKCSKLSRMKLVLNLTVILNVDVFSDHMGQVKIIGYQFRSNEYRKGPIEFMLGLCSASKSNEFDIPNMLAHSNMQCPFLKVIGRKYHIYNLSPNATNMPPLIPEGKWMLELTFLYMNKYTGFVIEWYSGVEYPVPIPKFSS